MFSEIASDIDRRRKFGRLEVGRVISGKYRLERLIAAGGMGSVFLATQLPIERPVALKLMTPQPADRDFRRRFLLEASICAHLAHRHIVTVHDYGESEEGDLYIAMEYLDGAPLSKLIADDLHFSSERTCRIALQIARALRAAHAAGVVHRDLKPSNVILQSDEDEESRGEFVKVLDFGLVKVFSNERGLEANTPITHAGMLLGSPDYMAPEQVVCGAIDPRTDIYALGAVIFHMLAGRPPFLGSSAVEIMNRHLTDMPPSIAASLDRASADALAPELEVIVQRAMAKDPGDRYVSMDELIADLKAVQRLISNDGSAGHAMPPPSRPLPISVHTPAALAEPLPGAPTLVERAHSIAIDPHPAKKKPRRALIGAAIGAAAVSVAVATFSLGVFDRDRAAPEAVAPATVAPANNVGEQSLIDSADLAAMEAKGAALGQQPNRAANRPRPRIAIPEQREAPAAEKPPEEPQEPPAPPEETAPVVTTPPVLPQPEPQPTLQPVVAQPEPQAPAKPEVKPAPIQKPAPAAAPVIIPARRLGRAQMEYPQRLLEKGIEADVTAMITVAADGEATDVDITKPSEYEEFNYAAKKVALRDKYSAATKNGVPIEYELEVVFRFRLSESERRGR